MRVEQLSVRSGVSVDTVRYYQSKGLLDPPRREGRVAWYDDGHLDRLARIRTLQQRGFTLATIARLVSGDLDAADEALLGRAVRRPPVGRPRVRRRPLPDPRARPRPDRLDHRRSWPPPPGCRWPCSRRSRPKDCSFPGGSATGSTTTPRTWRRPKPASSSSSGASRSPTCSTWPGATIRPPRRWPTRRWPCSPPTCGVRSAGAATPMTSPAPRTGDVRPSVAGLLRAAPGGQRPGRASTSPAPWSMPHSITWTGSVPTPNGRRSGRSARAPRGRRCRSAGDRSAPVPPLVTRLAPGTRGRSPHRCGEDRVGALDVRRHRPALRPGQSDDDLRAWTSDGGGDRPGRWACRPASRVLDLACGTGDFLTILDRAGLRSRWAWICPGGC